MKILTVEAGTVPDSFDCLVLLLCCLVDVPGRAALLSGKEGSGPGEEERYTGQGRLGGGEIAVWM